ncbi:MAG: hypothetical protein GY706_01265 [Bacteroides sp.]|nr:hypothetical protein [Bacteroides sp.]
MKEIDFMRILHHNFKLICFVGLLAGLALLGCDGSDGPLDEPGQRYQAFMDIRDFSDLTLSIDILQNDCDGEPEEYGDVVADINISVDASAPGISLRDYTIEYFALISEDGTGNMVMPPDLDRPFTGFYNFDIPSGGSGEFSITCMTVDTKEEYRNKVGYDWYLDTAGWQADIDDKQDDIDAKEADIDAKQEEVIRKQIEIADLEAAGQSTIRATAELTILQDELEDLETELEELETELTELEDSPIPVVWIFPELLVARYNIRITLNFEDTHGEERTIVLDRTVWLGPYNNC